MSARILVAVTGGISAYKAVDVISALKKVVPDIYISVMATENALQFVTKNTLAVTAHKYLEEDWSKPVHIDATDPQTCNMFVVVPATANILAKFAYGLADDLVSSSYIALPKDTKKLIFPAMNTRMWLNEVVQRNVVTLKHDGCIIVDPASGMLACGTEGIGKLPSTKEIVGRIVKELETT